MSHVHKIRAWPVSSYHQFKVLNGVFKFTPDTKSLHQLFSVTELVEELFETYMHITAAFAFVKPIST